MNISIQNRNNAYHTHTDKNSQCDRIKALLIANEKGLTIGELSNMTKLPKSTISGRINDLKPNVIEIGKKKDVYTDKSVTIWKIVNNGNELSKVINTPKKMLKKINALCLQHKCELSEIILKEIWN